MKIGIVCDNYKLEKFKKELSDNNLIFIVKDGTTKNTKIIIVYHENQEIVKYIFEQVEEYFRENKAKLN